MRRYLLIVGVLVAAHAAGQEYPEQEIPPPPLPPSHQPVPPPSGGAPEERPRNSALDRYDKCFQKMVDKGLADNDFIRRCLGIPARSKTPKGNGGKPEYLDEKAAQAALRKGFKSLKKCHGAFLQSARKLGIKPQGAVQPILEVARDGKVTEVRFSPTSITDVHFLKCLKSALTAMTFPPFTRKEPVEIHHSFGLSRGRLLPEEGYPQVRGIPGLTDEEKLEVYKSGTPGVRSCYERLLKRAPSAGGRVGVKLVVNRKGRVETLEIKESTIKDQPFEQCLEKRIRRWRFPKPRGGQEVTIHYPFIFQPLR